MNKKVVLAFGIAALSCGVATPAFADDPVTGSTDFTVTVNPYLNLTLTSADMSAGNIISLPLTPSSGGTYGSKSLTATASTNNAYGYTLVMSTPHTYLESNTINVNDGTYPHIEAVESRTGGRTAAEFEANTHNDMNKWGISIDNTTSYNPIALSQNLKKVTTPVADSATVINMATVLDLLTPPGSYSTTMNFELVANAATGSLEQALIDAGKEKVTVGNNKYYRIQDVNTAICNATTDTTDVLEVVDIRDNTIYRIGKLADNRCWLLDNLALNPLANGVSITTDNTNASAEAITNLLEGSATAPHTGWSTEAVSVETSSNTFTQPRINADSKLTVPQGSNDPLKTEAYNGNWKVGIYYNYCAASVGTYCFEPWEGVDTNQTSATDVDQDICPSGWRLPTGGAISSTGTTTGGGEYQSLIDAYPTISSGEDQYTRFRKATLMPLSGLYQSGTAQYQGEIGGSRSSTYAQTHAVHGLYLSTTEVQSNTHDRSFGSPIRCIAK